MRQQRPSFETPRKAWYEPRIESEKELIEEYGLKNKKEVWKAKSTARKWRREARRLTAAEDDARKQELLNKLQGLGLVSDDATLDDILEVTTADILDRRLQTVVYRKGLANTVKQARQFVVHGHVRLDNTRVDIPSYKVTLDEEENIAVSDHVLQHVKGEAADTRTQTPQEPEPDTEEPEEETPGEEEQEETEEEQEEEQEETEEQEEAEPEEVEEELEEEPEEETVEETTSDTADYTELVDNTITDAKEELQSLDDPDFEAALEAEQNGKDRTTFIDWLETRQGQEEDEEGDA